MNTPSTYTDTDGSASTSSKPRSSDTVRPGGRSRSSARTVGVADPLTAGGGALVTGGAFVTAGGALGGVTTTVGAVGSEEKCRRTAVIAANAAPPATIMIATVPKTPLDSVVRRGGTAGLRSL